MCVIFFSYKNHPDYKLILASNRDEFYSRPTQQMHWWQDYPSILAGKDLKQGGTWLGLTYNGRFATLTNYRDFHSPRIEGISRGTLVLDFLKSDISSELYVENLSKHDKLIDGYNILVFDGTEMIYHSNKSESSLTLEPGNYGLSNALIDIPWPKVVKGKKIFNEIITRNSNSLTSELFGLLKDEEKFPDNLLPDTGIPIETEKLLSSIFIKSEEYGTRVSTVLTIDNQNIAKIEELNHLTGEHSKFEFRIQHP